MRQSRPLLPIRPLVTPARLGRRQHGLVFTDARAEALVRFEQSNLAVALASRPVWMRGPLFKLARSQPSSAAERHAA